ncbi:MAG: phospholipase D family protein [Ignavibacteriae bacterium]|nr:phospholipase D family protein [Ignavibacteriota bacterium]
MNFKLLKSPFENDFKTFLGKTKRELIISSPFINESGVSIFLNSIQDKSKIRVNVLTNLSVKNVVNDVTQPTALLKMYDSFQETTISSLERLHAKVYVVDETVAMIASANLTYGGLIHNFEYGVLIDDTTTVKLVKQDVLGYATLGNVIDKILLEKIIEESQKIERLKTEQENRIRNSGLAILLRKTEQQINDNLLENRVSKGKTINKLFSDTILYVLAKHGSLTTEELHTYIQHIHPDICDNSIDRVINGQRFGKKWKHLVRDAQQSLKKKGLIQNNGKRGRQQWFLITG